MDSLDDIIFTSLSELKYHSMYTTNIDKNTLRNIYTMVSYPMMVSIENAVDSYLNLLRIPRRPYDRITITLKSWNRMTMRDKHRIIDYIMKHCIYDKNIRDKNELKKLIIENLIDIYLGHTEKDFISSYMSTNIFLKRYTKNFIY